MLISDKLERLLNGYYFTTGNNSAVSMGLLPKRQERYTRAGCQKPYYK